MMKRNALMLSGAAIGLVMLAGASVANPPTWSHAGGNSHPAPAPLLAAGIPAFAALGGAAAVGRFMRRRKAKTSVQTEDAELASNEVS
jgi:hypothetical protein